MHARLAPLWDMASLVAVNGTVVIVSANAGESPMQASRQCRRVVWHDIVFGAARSFLGQLGNPSFPPIPPPPPLFPPPLPQAGYEEMLENWALHADKVGLQGHYIIFAAEKQSFDYANKKWPGQALLLDLEGQFVHEDENVDVSKAIGINSAGFHRVASRRAVYILHLLAFGFSVLYSDIDIALLQNPLPFFAPLSSLASPSPDPTSPPAPPPPKEFDVFITADQAWTNGPDHTVSLAEPGLPMVMCSCFLFFRTSAGAKALASMWAFSMVARGHEIGLDQDHLLNVIKIMRERGIEANIGVLPGKKFPSGELMQNDMMGFLGLKPGVVMVHANYVVGKRKKIERLIEAGVWLLPPPAPEGEEESKGEGGSGGSSSGGDGSAGAGAAAAAAAASGGEGEEGEEEMERRLMGVAEWVPSHVDAVLKVAPGVARDGPLILTVLCHASESDLFMSWLGAISKLGLSTNFLASVASQVPLPANAPANHVIRQPTSAASTGGSGSEEKGGEKVEERDRLACLLMPALLASRLLAANISVLFSQLNNPSFPTTAHVSDPSTAWLRNPLPFLPATFSVILPSTSHSSTPPILDTTAPTPLNRSHLGSLSPWLLLLRPFSPSSSTQPPSSPSATPAQTSSTHALALSWGLQAFKALSKEPSLSNKAEGDSESTPLALSVAVQSALNHAIARVVEGEQASERAGERAAEGAGEGASGEGITIGILPAFLFPPSVLVCEERQWVQQHRGEVVAFHNSCGASMESKASLLKELQLWVDG
ncbi:unnamed protein product [Closterium sp. Yama58-4]|nr:unnamed protein product [Closterium sp. Yama58-4]